MYNLRIMTGNNMYVALFIRIDLIIKPTNLVSYLCTIFTPYQIYESRPAC